MSNAADTIALGVNIDHVATLRQARGTRYPDPVQAAIESEQAGADAITLHLREDRRHIQERDVVLLQGVLLTRMNLEMAVEEGVLAVAEQVRPADCCLVPERREELTTEGGLDVAGQLDRIAEACDRLGEAGIRVSLFIDPEPAQIEAAVRTGAPVVEIHTGHYADAVGRAPRLQELERVRQAVRLGLEVGLQVNAGHGLSYQNVREIARIPGLRELNIGHAIIARALFTGLAPAVREMRRLMNEAPGVIYGVGVDVVQIARVEAALSRHGERFARRVLSPPELEDYRSSGAKAGFLAKRFAAKEAFVKALGTGFRFGVGLRQLRVRSDPLGRPYLEVLEPAAARVTAQGVGRAHLSLADEQDLAIAFVTLERA